MAPSEALDEPEEQAPAVHDPSRRLDLAFAALRDLPSGTFAACLGQAGGPTPPPPQTLVEAAGPLVQWLHSEEHPLSYVDPDHHLTVHQAWLRACQGPLRVARETVKTVRPLDPDGATVPGWYDLTVVDLTGVAAVDAVIVVLRAVEAPLVEEPQAELPTRSWFQGTTSFRLRLDMEGNIQGGTHNLEELLGQRLADLIGTPVLALSHPEDRPAAIAQWERLAQRTGIVPPIRLRLKRADDRWIWSEITSWNLIDEDGARTVISDVREVQAEVEAEEAEKRTRLAHDRLVRVLDQVDDVVFVGQIDQGLLYLNAAARRVLGENAVGSRILDQLRPELRDEVTAEIIPLLVRMEPWAGEINVVIDGELRVMETSVSPVQEAHPGDISYGVIMRDVSKDRAREEALAAQARRDPLTDLPNRLALTEHLMALRAAVGSDEPVAICFIDLDNLKIVNDGLGHSAGDRLLKAVGERLLDREARLVARFGGDEFVVVLDAQDQAAVERAAEAILTDVAGVEVPGIHARVTASIGVATRSRSDLDAESVIRDADAAMYVAKNRGRAGIVHFDHAMREVATRRFELEAGLRQALEDGELSLAYQPVLALDGDRISGFEALARWSVASPDEFIPVAEDSGLVVPLGAWALRQALIDAKRLQAVGPHTVELRMGVNVSGHQLLDQRFAHDVLAVADELGVARDHVVLELTESVLIDPRDEIDAVLRTLRDGGISLALDDFGSGYSSVGYLRRYPIDLLKLDNSYTQRLLEDDGTRIIADAVVTMANRLGLRVVAEGVETPEQLAVVRELGITWAQGYLLGRPAPIDDAIATLAQAAPAAAEPPTPAAR